MTQPENDETAELMVEFQCEECRDWSAANGRMLTSVENEYGRLVCSDCIDAQARAERESHEARKWAEREGMSNQDVAEVVAEMNPQYEMTGGHEL